ncbi:MAG: hypothetical protein DMF62_08795 [Acidobacteria bacterium]|nr:MAG: hypothetical protein DMF62_08795 [Acidobacteriota bacterium]
MEKLDMGRFVLALLVVSFFSQSDVVMRRSNGCPLSSGGSECKPCLRPGSEPGKETYNKSPDVTEITLEKSELHIPPRKENEPRPVFSDELMVGVTVTAEDPEGDVLTYNYTISGGRIVGTGKKVSWSLNGLQPGTYTITAGVDDGCGVCGKTKSETITVIQD